MINKNIVYNQYFNDSQKSFQKIDISKKRYIILLSQE